MATDLTPIRIGDLSLSNPVIAGSSEATMSESGILSCLEAGAGAVVAKSINESTAAHRQLEAADYRLIARDWSEVPWTRGDAVDDTLFCRSGLPGVPLDDWLEMLHRCDTRARELGSMVISSITVGDPAAAPRLARRLTEATRALELNLSAPHGREAARGVIHMATEADGVRRVVGSVKDATDVPVLAKLTAQSSDVVGLARAAVEAGADAVVLTGRYLGFLPDLETDQSVMNSWGAIGGRWALPLTLYWVSKTHLALPDTPIIATNGIRTGTDVARAILAGASAVEMASAILTAGPRAITETITDLNNYLASRSVDSPATLVGRAARQARTYADLPPSTRHDWPWSDPQGR